MARKRQQVSASRTTKATHTDPDRVAAPGAAPATSVSPPRKPPIDNDSEISRWCEHHSIPGNVRDATCVAWAILEACESLRRPFIYGLAVERRSRWHRLRTLIAASEGVLNAFVLSGQYANHTSAISVGYFGEYGLTAVEVVLKAARQVEHHVHYAVHKMMPDVRVEHDESVLNLSDIDDVLFSSTVGDVFGPVAAKHGANEAPVLKERLKSEALQFAELQSPSGAGDSAPPPFNSEPPLRSAQSRDAAWPPDDGWHSRPGYCAFQGIKVPITGMPALILDALFKATYPVGELALTEAAGSVGAKGTLQSHLTRCRDILRTEFRIERSLNPIPSRGRGADIVWWIDRELLIQCAEALNGDSMQS